MAKLYGEQRWKRGGQVGEGGQAKVYLATREADPSVNFVLKELKKRSGDLGRARNEVAAAKKLQHANIVEIADYELDHTPPFIVFKYYVGGSLLKAAEVIRRRSLADRLRLFHEVCLGVAHAHQEDIVHRDINPANVFLKEDESPVVGDFGICFIEDHQTRMTKFDEAVGAQFYIAPELEGGRADITRGADVYSLGKLLYWLVGGTHLPRERQNEIKYDLTSGLLDISLQELRIRALFKELVNGCVQVDPAQRYADASQLSALVERTLRRLSSGANPTSLSETKLCQFCGVGTYKTEAADFAERKRDDKVTALFGAPTAAQTAWVVLQCDSCGEVRYFRTDNIRSQWRK